MWGDPSRARRGCQRVCSGQQRPQARVLVPGRAQVPSRALSSCPDSCVPTCRPPAGAPANPAGPQEQNARETRSHQRLRDGRLHGAAQGRSAFPLGPRRAGFSREDRYVRGQTGTRLNLATSPAHGTDPGGLDSHRSVAKPQPLPSGAPLPLPCVDPHG